MLFDILAHCFGSLCISYSMLLRIPKRSMVLFWVENKVSKWNVWSKNCQYFKNCSTDHKITQRNSIPIQVLHVIPNVQLIWCSNIKKIFF